MRDMFPPITIARSVTAYYHTDKPLPSKNARIAGNSGEFPPLT